MRPACRARCPNPPTPWPCLSPRPRRGLESARGGPRHLAATGRAGRPFDQYAGLDQVVSGSPADLVATVQAGATIETIRRQLAEHETWLAIDPPGRPDRSIGSIAATGTAGPLRHGFGPIRDHVLGCIAVTGDGRLVRAGGRVVKNVAGYDLTKLQVGGFGGFGIITELHVPPTRRCRARTLRSRPGDRGTR